MAMIKKSLLLAATTLSLLPTGNTHAQTKPCATDEMRQKAIQQHPEILEMEAEFERQIQAGIKKINLNNFAKKTAGDQTNNPNFVYDIPVVVHIIHDFNTYNTSTFNGDFIPDDFIYKAVKDWNIVFAKQNADTADVIAPFKKYIGNPRIRLHLATKDPNGNPTKGITRRRSYLTYTASDKAKFDGWPNDAYMNLWFINKMSDDHANAAAYAYKPATAAYIPYYDGVISLASYMNNGSKTMPHELGHEFNLDHTWGGTNQPNVACGDDNVDDTPPTKGHTTTGCTFASLFDSTCATNYFKLSTDADGNTTLINYPDTTNAQNIMDYTYCDKMFSKGQCERMIIALNSDVAGRNNLWDSTNLELTGALKPIPDLKPTPEFSITNVGATQYMGKNANFTFLNKDVVFTNFSYNDTVDAVNWEFTNGSVTVTRSSRTNFNQQFTSPGWYDVKMTATGNRSGDSTRIWPKAFYVAGEAVNPAGYVQDFAEGSDREKWPMFNYFNNEFRWEQSNVGVYDNSSIKYKGFDDRVSNFSIPLTGSPKGDYDDLFSVPFDLTGVGSNATLYYFYSGASRSSLTTAINDSMFIEYSTNKGTTWSMLSRLGKGDLFNKGAISTPYTPTGTWDWVEKGIKLPTGAISNNTVFRFRYKPGENENGISTGNNFYIDRISVSPFAVNINNVAPGTINVQVLPNPTQGDAWVVVNDVTNADAKVVVTDVTGKVIYTNEMQVAGNQARFVIPASAISVKGMYLVNVVTGNQNTTQKLVVY
jgi:hypothetical protein